MNLYTKNELFCSNTQKIYDNKAEEARFYLGGIGTGNFCVGSRGQLANWQLFNQPGFDNILPYTFFAIRTESESSTQAKVLEAELNPPFSEPEGVLRSQMGGLPRFQSSEMRAEYPFVTVKLVDDEMPVEVEMESFTPFVPLNADKSGIPGAYIKYHVKNSSSQTQHVSIAGSIVNAVGFDGYDLWKHLKILGNSKNECRKNEYGIGVFLYGENVPEHHIANGTMSLLTTNSNVTCKPLWLRGDWTDGAQDFWDDFVDDGRLNENSTKGDGGCAWAEKYEYSFLHFTDAIGSLCCEETLLPGEEKEFEFILTWYFPNRVRGWIESDLDVERVRNHDYTVVQNYYAKQYTDAWNVAEYLVANKKELTDLSRSFADAFYSSTLPGYVIEAVANTITVLRSPTCFRINDGFFMSWEGVREDVGAGAGTCTHVWNYAQTAAFLFPELEREMRLIEFTIEAKADGFMPFRTYRSYGLPSWDMVASADGQLGTIVRLYREWRISGDDAFMKKCYPHMIRVMDYSIRTWDKDEDGVLEQPQHVTYDTEVSGITSMVTSIYIAALLAASSMAKAVGDSILADKYESLALSGAKKLDELTFNGEFYVQKTDDIDAVRYQYGEGCLSDQLLGQFLAFEAGMGYLLPEEHVKKALKAIVNYNFVYRAKDFPHVQRAYILNDEKGLTPCTWPNGGRPRMPFVYFGEVWTGIEYEVAALLLRAGELEDGLSIVKAVRDRHDGVKRNPWSDNESGYNYVRSMSSYAIWNALLGINVDNVNHTLSFSPKMNEANFKSFWSNGKAWGTYEQAIDADGEMRTKLKVLYGSVDELSIAVSGKE